MHGQESPRFPRHVLAKSACLFGFKPSLFPSEGFYSPLNSGAFQLQGLKPHFPNIPRIHYQASLKGRASHIVEIPHVQREGWSVRKRRRTEGFRCFLARQGGTRRSAGSSYREKIFSRSRSAPSCRSTVPAWPRRGSRQLPLSPPNMMVRG